MGISVARQPTLIASPAQTAAWMLVAVLAIGHAGVDAAGNFTLARISGIAAGTDYATAWWMTETYNLLAFAPQVLLGALADRTRLWLHATLLGCVMVATACVVDPSWSTTAIALTSMGNALYHIGAGAMVLQLARGNAAMPGVFVGPGDMGVILGVALARSRVGAGMGLAGVVLILAALVLTLQSRMPSESRQPQVPPLKMPGRIVCALLALFCLPVVIRSLMGSAVFFPWNETPAMMLWLAIAATLAKAFGGFVADRFGWMITTVPAAIVAAPLLAFGGLNPSAAIGAMVLVQLAMPVTLAGMARATPRWPGFTFGLAATCLSIAAVPPLLSIPPFSAAMLGALQVVCAISLFTGISVLRKSGTPAWLGGRDEAMGAADPPTI